MELIRVILLDMPATVRGLTTYSYDDDGQAYYTIFINSLLSDEMQVRAYDHEIIHINNKDFDSMVSATELEQRRHAV